MRESPTMTTLPVRAGTFEPRSTTSLLALSTMPLPMGQPCWWKRGYCSHSCTQAIHTPAACTRHPATKFLVQKERKPAHSVDSAEAPTPTPALARHRSSTSACAAPPPFILLRHTGQITSASAATALLTPAVSPSTATRNPRYLPIIVLLPSLYRPRLCRIKALRPSGLSVVRRSAEVGPAEVGPEEVPPKEGRPGEAGEAGEVRPETALL